PAKVAAGITGTSQENYSQGLCTRDTFPGLPFGISAIQGGEVQRYPQDEDANVTVYLHRVKDLPIDATAIC
ncbi:MAG: hypothetical protein M0Z66_13170, partial [Thermaerobacter sp.]|nr:hypothetical protein [Thermaerobacter sp.]